MSIHRLKNFIEELDLGNEAPYLVLGRKTGKRVNAGTYPINEDMQTELRDIAKNSIDRIAELEMYEYTGPTALVTGEEGFYVSASDLNADADFLELLTLPDRLNRLTSEALVDKSLSFYAIAIGADNDDRAFFVRKWARTRQTSELLMARIAADLRPIRNNMLLLDRHIDFILHREGAVVFESRAFEAYVQNPEDVAEQMDEELDVIAERLPFDEVTLAALKQRGRKGVILRRRIHAITESDYFENITIKDLRAEFLRLQKDPTQYIQRGQLSFTMENAAFVLKVLDEAAWVGRFSGKVHTTNAKRDEP